MFRSRFFLANNPLRTASTSTIMVRSTIPAMETGKLN
jgi:hypothetical protein